MGFSGARGSADQYHLPVGLVHAGQYTNQLPVVTLNETFQGSLIAQDDV
jgi:hypothetical protein